MKLEQHYSLQFCNTFGIDVQAEHFVRITREEDLLEVIRNDAFSSIRILGGGSNILLTQDVQGCLVKNEINGIEIVEEDEASVLLKIGGGEVWHDLVLFAIDNHWGGIENLSLIPGTCGAAPIQNIGAYGVELKDVFEKLEAIELQTGQKHFFDKKDCQFGYRKSVFKDKWKGKLCITNIYLRLQKMPHRLQLSYGIISKTLEEKGISQPSIKDVSEVVIAIRQSKLPSPDELGNSGSFFKNPEIHSSLFQLLQKDYPNIPSYPLPDGKVKIPAAWLIDQCGFKGVIYGNTGCYGNQPLVIVNYGGASGEEILAFSRMVQKKVQDTFNIRLYPEVNIW